MHHNSQGRVHGYRGRFQVQREGPGRKDGGARVNLKVDKTPAQPGEVVLSVRDLTVCDDRGIEQVRGLNLDVRAGEIVGIAGIDGNGQESS